jgi:hypothetical protein
VATDKDAAIVAAATTKHRTAAGARAGGFRPVDAPAGASASAFAGDDTRAELSDHVTLHVHGDDIIGAVEVESRPYPDEQSTQHVAGQLRHGHTERIDGTNRSENKCERG